MLNINYTMAIYEILQIYYAQRKQKHVFPPTWNCHAREWYFECNIGA